MVVAAAGAGFDVGKGPARGHAVLGGELGDFFGGEFAEDLLDRLAVQRAVGAVERFETLEHEHESLDVPALEAVVLAIHGMSHGVGKFPAFDQGGKLVDVIRGGLEGVVIVAGDSPDQQVNLAMIFGEEAGDFLADEDIRRAKTRDAGDGIVVGNGDEIHAAAFGLAIDVGGSAESFRGSRAR